jgi:hypothetical protein
MDQKRPTTHARAKCCSAQLLLFPSPALLCLRERVREVQSTQMFAETVSNILGRIFLRTYTNKILHHIERHYLHRNYTPSLVE